jgi:UDP-N-acetyl-D-mannosaminuronate dehydrogenase
VPKTRKTFVLLNFSTKKGGSLIITHHQTHRNETGKDIKHNDRVIIESKNVIDNRKTRKLVWWDHRQLISFA